MGNTKIGSTSTLSTCSINPRVVDEDGVIGCFDLASLGTLMVPIENNFNHVANIKSFTS